MPRSSLRPGDERTTLDIETKMSLRPMRGVIHANPRSFDDRESVRRARRADVEVIAEQIVVIEALVDVHRPAQQPRPLRSSPYISDGFDGAQQDGRSVAFTLGH